jgi:hypothetical protein
MRISSSATVVSWIPSEAISGPLVRVPFDLGFTHYDPPPPDELDDVLDLIRAGAIRLANRIEAWIEVADGKITAHGRSGHSYINETRARIGPREVTFQPTRFPEVQEEEAGEASFRFSQTAGGRPGIPAPRRVHHAPFLQLIGPTVWTTVALTLTPEGPPGIELTDASSFPRHWVYDGDGKLVAKSGSIDFQKWYRHDFGRFSPWGARPPTPAVVAAAETALEHELSVVIMQAGHKPKLRSVKAGKEVMRQGEEGAEVFLILDGVVNVDVDGKQLGDLGPGTIIGERAVLEGGTRTATVTATTDCKLAVANVDEIDRESLAALAELHRREEADG